MWFWKWIFGLFDFEFLKCGFEKSRIRKRIEVGNNVESKIFVLLRLDMAVYLCL